MQVFDKRYWVVACVLLVAGCGTTRPPAPIVNRTGSQAVAAVKPAEPPVVAPPVAARPDPAEAGAQTAPVRSSGVEVRSLETRPLESAPGAASTPPVISTAPATAPTPTAPAAAPPAGAPSTAAPSTAAPSTAATAAAPGLRTQPKGLKRPYSDATLAEMKTPDAPKVDPAAIAKAADAAAAATAGKPADGDYVWPAKGTVLQAFAEPKNMGITIDGKLGDPIVAAADGKVIFSGPGPRGYGNLLIVKHDADTVSVYAHNKALLVKEGQAVKRGQRIADLGDSGTDKPNLHFEIRKQGKPVDPQKLLPKR